MPARRQRQERDARRGTPSDAMTSWSHTMTTALYADIAQRRCRRGHVGAYAWYSGVLRCGSCRRAQSAAFREANLESERQRQREYYRRDPEKYRARRKAWLEANPEKANAWARAHPGRVRELQRSWLEANRVKVTQRVRARHYRYDQGDLTQDQWDEIVREVNGKCLACGADKVTLDHIVPLSRGGQHTASNVQPLCGPCNKRKFTKTIDYRSCVTAAGPGGQ